MDVVALNFLKEPVATYHTQGRDYLFFAGYSVNSNTFC